jgi:hypothetical protein
MKCSRSAVAVLVTTTLIRISTPRRRADIQASRLGRIAFTSTIMKHRWPRAKSAGVSRMYFQPADSAFAYSETNAYTQARS